MEKVKCKRQLVVANEEKTKECKGVAEQMRCTKCKRKEPKGITLIALVITIVILIILATITIQAAFGEDGLIKRAIQAKNLTEQATREEAEALNSLLEEYDSIIGGGETTPSDNTAPQVLISFDNTTMTTKESITATVTMSDSDSGVNITGSKWVLTTSSGYIGAEDGSYTNSFTTNPEEIKLTATTAGEYYVHILAKDNAGNTIEFVSSKITVEDAPKSEVEEAIKDGNVFEEKTEITDEQGNRVTIPEGFKVADDSGKTVQEGIVIEDNFSEDEGVRGSQYVWIPVGKFKKNDGTMSNEIVLGRYTFDSSDGTPELQQAAYTSSSSTNYTKQVEVDYGPFIEISTYRAGSTSTNATPYNLAKWVNSVRTNGGYYIGRYEASYASGNSTSNYKAASKVSTSYGIQITGLKQGNLWTYITEQDASKVSINTYANSSIVKSDLMNSYSWDTAVVFLQEAGYDNFANEDCKDGLANTGTNGSETCKIHDLAANASEWSTEYAGESGYNCVFRGSSSMRFRTNCKTTIKMLSIGFRITLSIE